MNPTRATIAITAASVLCAWGAVEAYQWENGYQRQNHDPYLLSSQEARLTNVESMVPENAVMGYVTDLDAGSNEDSAAFNSARYVLAPRLLLREPNEKWVVGIIKKPESVARFAAANHLEVVQPLNNMVILYARGSAQ